MSGIGGNLYKNFPTVPPGGRSLSGADAIFGNISPNASLSQKAMFTGRKQSKTTGGKGSVPSSVGRSMPGVYSGADASAWQRAVGGLKTTTTATPNIVTDIYGNQRILGVTSNTSKGMSIDEADVARAAMGDIEAQKQAKAETRQIAEGAVQDVNQQYQESVGRLRQMLDETAAQQQTTQEGADQQVQDRFDQARQFAMQQNEQVEERIQQEQTKIEQQVQARREQFKSTFGLQMSNMVEGMRSQYQDDLGAIEEAAARGVIDPANMEALRTQAKQQYQNRLASVAAQVGTQYAQSHDAMLQSTNKLLADMSTAMTQTEATMGSNISNVLANLAGGYSQYKVNAAQQARLADAARMEQAIAIENLAVRRPELAAEIKLSSAYLPSAVMEYPVWKELYDMQQLALSVDEQIQPINIPEIRIPGVEASSPFPRVGGNNSTASRSSSGSSSRNSNRSSSGAGATKNANIPATGQGRLDEFRKNPFEKQSVLYS